MGRSFLARCGIVAVAASLVITLAASAQVVPDDYLLGTHIVREGDTLRGITRAYLGSEELWRDNWKLNPEVEDPDRLFPLQRLRVLLAPKLARPTARLVTIAGDVQGKPAPSDWNRSEEDDLMLERDGIRAGENSSAAMQFTDGSELTLKDESTVFLRVAGRSLRGYEQRSVEIVQGQADLAAASLSEETEIEVVIGNTVATPSIGESGGLETRARRADDGGARVMVFEGMGEVVASGASVTVPRGMGTAVPESGPPAPPEKLLPAATGLFPEPGGTAEVGRRSLSWSAVEGATSYTVELCRDPECANLIMLRKGLAAPGWDGDDVPTGEFLWRVTAVSESGLDGYATETRGVQIVEFKPDTTPPVGEFSVSGPSVENRGIRYYDSDLEVRFTADDDMSGVAEVTLRVDGEEVAPDDLLGSWKTGDYSITAQATDAEGNVASFGPVEVHVDADPPVLTTTAGRGELLFEPASQAARWNRRAARWSQCELKNVLRRGRAARWTLLDWSAEGRPSLRDFQPNLLRRQPPSSGYVFRREEVGLLLFAPALVVAESGEKLRSGILLLESADERSGMVEVELRERVGPDGWKWLELEAVDRLGNQGRHRWQFAGGD